MRGFGTCLKLVLGDAVSTPPPEPNSSGTLVFWQQWLAERNLGLVPVAEPQRFEWAGYWIVLVPDPAGELRAVVMFGLPSGPVLDPTGVLSGEVLPAIEAGFVVAPLAAGLQTNPQGSSTSPGGVVEGLLIAPAACAPLRRLDSARGVVGRGLEGDRYAERRGTFGGNGGNGYDLTLIEAEAVEQLNGGGIELTWEDARRNVVTRGIDLNALVGRRFSVGDVECVGRRLAEPCAHLERLTRPGVLRGLVHRGGLRADIVGSGTIAIGDTITAQG